SAGPAGGVALARAAGKRSVARFAKRGSGAFQGSDGHCAPVHWRSLILVANRGAPSKAPSLRGSKAQNSKKERRLRRQTTRPPVLQSRSGWIRNAVADSVAPTKGQEGVVNGFEPHRSSDLHMEDRQAWQG